MLIAQISDPHVTDADQGVDSRFETAMHLRRAVKHLSSLPIRPDLVIVTGDCVD
jgi:3',5'-cyclic AMP phosphodiesterase CpdA